MPSSLIKTVNFGKTKSGLAASVGYRLIDNTGAVAQDRTQTDVYETFPGTGIYASTITFTSGFKGTILWDTGESNPAYAAEDFNDTVNGSAVSQQVADVTGRVGAVAGQVESVAGQVIDLADQIRFIRGMTTGRWTLNKKDSTMTYYDESGQNKLVTYELLDENGKPSIESVYDRRIIEAVPMIMDIAIEQQVLMSLNVTGSII
jgi:hypothetical protein